MNIPFMNLQAQLESIRSGVEKAMASVLESGQFIMGPEVAAFEREFAAFCRVRRCVGVANGTDALVLALRAAGIRPGERVVTVPNTFIATAEAVTAAGGRVEFVDIDPTTCLMDPNLLEAKVKKLRSEGIPLSAVIAVHLYGQPCDMEAISSIARRYELRVIEDAAQAHGAEDQGRRVGTLGDAACFSFYPGKNLGAYGDAGAVTSESTEIADKVALLRNHGRVDKYDHLVEGVNSRLDALQAAILRVKLPHLEEWTERRIRNADRYTKALTGRRGLTVLSRRSGVRHVYHLYVVRTQDREAVQQRLQKDGVATGVHYPHPLHLLPAYAHLGHVPGDFPHAEQACREVLSLPMDAEITAEQIDQVCRALNSALQG